MEAGARGYVEVEVGMMNAMQTPEQRHCVEHQVLQVDRQVEGQHRQHNRPRIRHVDEIEHAHAARGRKGGNANRCHGKDCPHQDAIQDRERQVVGPAQRPSLLQRASWRQQLPHRHRREDAEEGTQPNRHLVG
jgi:hypothetical protein